jgi:ABC-type Fe3+-hydroxamate transport system substrate-binding protein
VGCLFDWALAVALALALAALLTGCATTRCDPVCCADCPKEIEVVEAPPEVITVLGPAVHVVDLPPLPSIHLLRAWAAGEVDLDRNTLLTLVAADLVTVWNRLVEQRQEAIASNVAREGLDSDTPPK